MPGSTKPSSKGKVGPGIFVRPQGVPRGFLRQYILHRIGDKPAHGYDLLQEIEAKTEGSWRPGAGSIYPILKELVAEGYLKPESPKKRGRSQRIYHITPDGSRCLRESSDMLLKAGQNWGAMRRIMVEIIDPPQIPSLITHMATGQFKFVREILESKRDKIPRREAEFMLREYALNLERQLEWTNRMLKRA